MVEPKEKQEIREILIAHDIKVDEQLVDELYTWLYIKLDDQYKFLES